MCAKICTLFMYSCRWSYIFPVAVSYMATLSLLNIKEVVCPFTLILSKLKKLTATATHSIHYCMFTQHAIDVFTEA